MSKLKPNKEEKEILKDFAAGEFESALTTKRKKYIQGIAEETFKKDKRINIRISSRDLRSLQRRALEEGIPRLSKFTGFWLNFTLVLLDNHLK